MEHRKKILGTGLLLLLMAFGSQALTLGRASSAAVIGRSLDLAIAVQMEAGETPASLCFEADVFHGDVRQDPSRVKVLVEPAAQPNKLNVRVQSATAVDEPVVTVYLRTGCGQKTTRRYVLLADFPSTVVASAVPLAVPASTVAPARAPAAVPPALTAAAPTPVAADPLASGEAPAKAAAPRAPRASSPQSIIKRSPAKVAPDAPRAPADTVRPVPRPAGGPRLQLDPLEFLSDRIANLDGEMTFEAPPDALQSIDKIKTLEESLKSLRLLAAKNEASLNALQARLQQEEASGFSRQAGYALIALALVCLAAMAVAVVLWRRQGQNQTSDEWWGNAGTPEPQAQEDIDTQPSKLPISPAPSKWPASAQSRHPSRQHSEFAPSQHKRSSFGVDVNLTEMSDSAFVDFMPTGLRPGLGSKLTDVPPASVPAAQSARNLNSDAVLDIRQQAEFFISLGQSERAAQLLRREIKENPEPNPFVYLDLLALFHSLGLKAEFQQLRESFELLFCCRIPAFTFFKNRSLDLESYPDVLASVAELWPEPPVLLRLEGCIFQNPDKSGGPGFDLAAFRDLLFLHAVARILVETPDSQAGVSVRAVAPAPPAPAAVARAQPGVQRQELPVSQPVAMPAFDALDLDLSSPSKSDEKGPKPASSMDESLPFLMAPDPKFDKPVKRS